MRQDQPLAPALRRRADFSIDIEIGGETFPKEPNLLQPIACLATSGRGADSFIAMIHERLTLLRDWLTTDWLKAAAKICSQLYPITGRNR